MRAIAVLSAQKKSKQKKTDRLRAIAVLFAQVRSDMSNLSVGNNKQIKDTKIVAIDENAF